MWYETQERAMAPGSGDGWPKIIRPQHSGNARLVRRGGSPEVWINILNDCDSEMSAIAAGRPADKDACKKLADQIRTAIVMFAREESHGT